jgi:hypothetical protein
VNKDSTNVLISRTFRSTAASLCVFLFTGGVFVMVFEPRARGAEMAVVLTLLGWTLVIPLALMALRWAQIIAWSLFACQLVAFAVFRWPHLLSGVLMNFSNYIALAVALLLYGGSVFKKRALAEGIASEEKPSLIRTDW